jgi:serine/threonine-protein kinase
MRFGKYTLLRKLATGGMAEIFLAIQRSVAGFEKLLVIKRILPQMNNDRAFIEMLLHEARVAATLSHPNIVQIFDVGEVDGTFFIAMEHVHGEDLRSIVRQMKKQGVLEFPLEHALAIALGMCAGLAYAHEKTELDGTPLGIVHRDISPQNVVVTFSGDVKIVDFGIAKSDVKATQDPTKSGKLKGKVPYMSPEQARGETVDLRTDIFATGILLFELTTGKRLFKGASEYETLKLICDKDYPRPSQVRPDYPLGLESIVMRALSRDPEQRYPNARALQADLEEFIRKRQIAVSNLALNKFMQSLFEEKLAAQKEALLQGKQLADIIDYNRAAEHDLELTMERRLSVTQSMPAAAHTVTNLQRPGGISAALGGLGFAALLLVGIAGGVVWSRRQAALPPTDARAEQPRGSIDVLSEPPGAAVWVNGDLRSETTPTTISGLPVGKSIEVKVTKDGFEQGKATLTVAAKPEAPVRFALKRAGFGVTVKVKPEGVQPIISMDGMPFEGHLDGVSPTEPHKLTVTAPGYAEQTISFTGAAFEAKQFDVVLEKIGTGKPASSTAAPGDPTAAPATTVVKPVAPVGNGKLNVGASGGWCNVAVDGANRGATPVAGLELPAGSHRISCTTQDGKTQTATVTVPPDGVARYKFTL